MKTRCFDTVRSVLLVRNVFSMSENARVIMKDICKRGKRTPNQKETQNPKIQPKRLQGQTPSAAAGGLENPAWPQATEHQQGRERFPGLAGALLSPVGPLLSALFPAGSQPVPQAAPGLEQTPLGSWRCRQLAQGCPSKPPRMRVPWVMRDG